MHPAFRRRFLPPKKDALNFGVRVFANGPNARSTDVLYMSSPKVMSGRPDFDPATDTLLELADGDFRVDYRAHEGGSSVSTSVTYEKAYEYQCMLGIKKATSTASGDKHCNRSKKSDVGPVDGRVQPAIAFWAGCADFKPILKNEKAYNASYFTKNDVNADPLLEARKSMLDVDTVCAMIEPLYIVSPTIMLK